MTVWIVWVLAIGLIFGMGLASARIGRREQGSGEKKKVNSVPGVSETAINDTKNEVQGFRIPGTYQPLATTGKTIIFSSSQLQLAQWKLNK